MADTSSAYYQAVAHGHSEEQIREWVLSQPDGKAALDHGYDLQAVFNHLADSAPEQQVEAGPKQISGWLRAPAQAATAVVHGLASTLGVPGDIESAISRFSGVPNLGNALSLGTPLPTSEDLLTGAGKFGLTDRNDLEPQDASEREQVGTARGVGAVLPQLAFGPGEAIFPTLLSGGASGLVTGLASEAHPGETNGLGAEALGIGAGVLTGNLGAGALRLGKMGSDLSPTGKLFKTADLPLRSPALTSGKPLGALLPYAPVEQTHGDIARSLESTADSLSHVSTLEDAGTYAQKRVHDWLATTLPAKESLAWRPVDAAIPGTAATPLTSFEGALNSMTGKGGSLAALVSKLQPVLPQQMRKILANGLGNLTGAAPTWSEVRELRSAIGRAMTDPKIAPVAGALNLQTMYSAITQDLSRTAKLHGALPVFQQANKESSRLHQFAENIAGQFIKGKSDRADIVPEKAAANWLAGARLRKGGSDLRELNSELPDVTRALASVHLRSLLETGANETVGGKLAKTWSSMSPEAKTELFPPKTREKLEAMSTIAARLQGLSKTPASATGHNALTGGMLTAAGAAAGQGALHYFGGHQLDLPTLFEILGGATTAGSVIGGVKNRALARIANSPLAARYAATEPVLFPYPASIPISAILGSEAENELSPKR